jgi:hypothetical protein
MGEVAADLHCRMFGIDPVVKTDCGRQSHPLLIAPLARWVTTSPVLQVRGEVPEWSNGAVSKTVVLATAPRVRIPPSPPTNFFIYLFLLKICMVVSI